MAICTLWRRLYLRDDWNDLSDTRSYTDAQVMDRLRSTSLFSTLRDLYTGGLSSLLDIDTLSKLIRRPSEALEIPTDEDMVERYSQGGYYVEDGYTAYTKEEIVAIHTELDKEREQLDELVGVLEGAGLWDEVARIEESERPREEDELDVKIDTSAQIVRGNSLGLDIEME
jgi:nuclear pore complex protein Nup133